MSDVERRRRGGLSNEEVADVEVFTGAQASEIRFGISPEVKVWFDGEPAERHSSETERENLPEEVEPDETYRHIRARWRARARIVHPTDRDG
jgi:hypothetical protein